MLNIGKHLYTRTYIILYIRGKMNYNTGSLCTVDDVKRIAGLSALEDVSDGEIGSFIRDATHTILSEYGNPLNVTYTQIKSSTGSTYYNFTGNYEPVYSITRLTIDGKFNDEVPSGSYTPYLDTGFVDIDLTYLEEHDGDNMKFEFIPEVYHQLVQNISAVDLLTNFSVDTGDDTEVSKIVRLTAKIASLRKLIDIKGAFSATAEAGRDELTQGSTTIEQSQW